MPLRVVLIQGASTLASQLMRGLYLVLSIIFRYQRVRMEGFLVMGNNRFVAMCHDAHLLVSHRDASLAQFFGMPRVTWLIDLPGNGAWLPAFGILGIGKNFMEWDVQGIASYIVYAAFINRMIRSAGTQPVGVEWGALERAARRDAASWLAHFEFPQELQRAFAQSAV